MTARALHPMRGVGKEIRALRGVWVAGAVALGVLSFGDRDMTLAVYAVVAVALGATSFGHEYGSRTLGMWLAQPVSRTRLFLTKMGVLAALLAALALVAAWALTARWSLAGLAMLSGLFVAPWLTMASQRMLGGAALTAALPALLWTVGDLVAVWHFGLDPRVREEALEFKETVFVWGTLIWTAIGAVFTWRTFMSLEDRDGAGRAVQLFTSRSVVAPVVHPSRRWHVYRPLQSLLLKELRLQQVTLAAAGAYLVLFPILQLTPESARGTLPGLFSAVTYLYAGLVPVLAGAVASAEERQLGTLGWQLLQPVAVSKQWQVKVAVVLTTTAVLGVALPLALKRLLPPIETFRATDFEVSAVFALAIVSLYVSSLNSNALKALVTSIPVIVLAAVFVTVVVDVAGSPVFRVIRMAFRQMLAGNLVTGGTGWMLSAIAVGMTLMAGAVLALVLRFASVNHRSLDHDVRTILKQAAWMAASVVAAVLVASGSFALLAPYFLR